jgi:hypothetical protein
MQAYCFGVSKLLQLRPEDSPFVSLGGRIDVLNIKLMLWILKKGENYDKFVLLFVRRTMAIITAL